MIVTNKRATYKHGAPAQRADPGRRRLGVLVGLVCVFLPVRAATGQTATVSTVAQLRSAIGNSSISTILMNPGTYLLTSSGSGQLVINRNLTITRNGSGTVIIDGGNASRVFDVTNGTVSISDVTIRGGNASGTQGGGVRNTANLTLTRVIVTTNSAEDGGGIGNRSGGTIQLVDVTVSGNTASRRGGGIENDQSGSTATLTRVTISGNTAVSQDGGAVINRSGAVLNLTNATLSGNTVGRSGGALRNEGTATLLNVTVTGNSAVTSGGGLQRQSGSLSVKNTIIAGNTSPSGANCSGTITSQGYNLESANSCALTGTGDRINTDPLLGPLQDNGGPTFTHALLSGSPAIDAGTNTGAPATDQRGIVRPQGPAADIGAFEVEVTQVSVTPDGGQNLRLLPSGPTYSFTFTVTSTGGAFDLLATKTGTAVTIVSVNGVAGDSARATLANGSTSIAVVYSIGSVAAGTVDTLRLRARSVASPSVFDPGFADVQVVRPTLSSASNQTFAVSDPVRPIATITITESSVATITAAADLRIRIPASLNMTWDTADLTAVIGGSAAAKVSPIVSYAGGGKTLVLDVTADFAPGDQITISGLGFAGFTAPSAASRLTLDVRNDGSAMATDDKTITIVAAGVPTISSDFDQSFRVGDPPIAISPITVVDNAVTRSITAVNDIRIRIPAGFNMSWDVSDNSAVILGTAAGKVSPIVTYENGGKTLVIDVLVDFAPGDAIMITGLSFMSFTAESPPDNLELEVRNNGVVSAEDDKSIFIVFIVSTPSLISSSDQSFQVGDPPTLMVSLRVTDDPVPTIRAANDIRIRIPSGMSMIWDTTLVTANFSGRGNSKVANPVRYEDGGKTLVIDVITDFGPDDWLNVRNLRFMNFTTASVARRLELIVFNDGVVNTVDTRTKRILGPTYDVAVIPDTQLVARLPTNGSGYTVDFTVANIGSIGDSYDLLTSTLPGGTIGVVSITGPGVTQGANPDSARLTGLGSGATVDVRVTYAVGVVPPGTKDTLVLWARSVNAPGKKDDGLLVLTVIRPAIVTTIGVTPGGTRLPGTELTYRVTVTNAGSAVAASVVTVDSLAADVDFKVGTVVNTLPAGVGVTLTYSDDGGATWTYNPVSGGCAAPATYDACVTHLRWALQNPLPVAPDNSAVFEFVARIR